MNQSEVRKNLLRGLYSLIWKLARPILRRNKRLGEGFSWRLVPEEWYRGKPVDLWIQAASGGESYLVWEILKHLTDQPRTILVTTWTRQGLEVLHGMAKLLKSPNLDIHITLFPLDDLTVMTRAINQAHPRSIVLLETELWPGLLLTARDHNIPVLILNGRMSAKSLRKYRWLDSLCRLWHEVAPQHITAISEEDAYRFAQLFGEEKVSIVPNIKFDRCLPTEDPSKKLSDLVDKQAPIILLASTREEEEKLLLRTIKRLHNRKATLILAPRHLHRISAWKEFLAKIGENVILRSKITDCAPVGSLILWDAFGELSELYALADAVFVGGSLAPLGGQNFLEPLSLGKVPCCGPYLENFAWAKTSQLVDEKLLILCSSPELLAETLLQQVNHPQPSDEIRQHFLNWIKPHLGGSHKSADLIRSTLKA